MSSESSDGKRWGLASLDLLGDPDDLRAQAEQVLARYDDARPRADHFEGVDGTNSIRTTVDKQSRVVRIDIDPQWKRRIGVDGFAAALFASYTAAIHESLGAAVHAALATDLDNERNDPSVPQPRAEESELGDQAWLRRTWTTLYDIRAQLSRLEEVETTARPDERTVSGPDGLVTLRLQGRSVIGIEADTLRIARADPDQLRFEALDAFRSAALAAED